MQGRYLYVCEHIDNKKQAVQLSCLCIYLEVEPILSILIFRFSFDYWHYAIDLTYHQVKVTLDIILCCVQDENLCILLSSLFCKNNSEKEVFLNLSFESIQTNGSVSIFFTGSFEENIIFQLIENGSVSGLISLQLKNSDEYSAMFPPHLMKTIRQVTAEDILKNIQIVIKTSICFGSRKNFPER